MKRLLLVLVLAVAAAITIAELADLTQSRPDKVDAAAVTEIVLDVDQDRFGTGEDGAADALWAVCAAQTRSRADDDGLQRVEDGRYRVVLSPAVGHHDERKLVGCLEDLTVDRVRGNVQSIRTLQD
jgi:hypothetical protein